jgi:prepilin-type N-terminal cleavage/methylation domain-containing protein
VLRAGGFTLLELLAVLFISGLLIALVGPRIGSRLTAYETHYHFQEIEDGLRQLPRRARLAGKHLVLPRDLSLTDLGDGLPPLALPEGWLLEATPPLAISSLGACSGARIRIQSATHHATTDEAPESRFYEIENLSCNLMPDERQHGS